MKKITKFKNLILDVLFPKFCLACQKEGVFLCSNCFQEIEFVKKQVCPICLNFSQNGSLCRHCRGKSHLNQLITVCHYNNPLIQKIIHVLKYRFVKDTDHFFLEFFKKFLALKPGIFTTKNYIIVPIPLHKRRLKFRGFNQAEIIAKQLSITLDKEIVSGNLIRKFYTEPQVDLNARERKINIRDVFVLKNPLEISGKSVILIDDVYTTGSTMQEAAKVLKKAKARKVIGLIIARG